MNIRYKPSTGLADVYANIKARQAELAEQEKAVKEALLKLGYDQIEGDYARVTIAHVAESKIFDGEAAQDLLEEHGLPIPTKKRAGYISFKVGARVADAKVAA